MSVRVNLIWTPAITKQSITQVLHARIEEPDGTIRRVEERITADRGHLHPLIVNDGSDVSWFIETTVPGSQPSRSPECSFTAKRDKFVSPVAVDLTVDLVNPNNEAGFLSGEIHRRRHAKPDPASQPAVELPPPETKTDGTGNAPPVIPPVPLTTPVIPTIPPVPPITGEGNGEPNSRDLSTDSDSALGDPTGDAGGEPSDAVKTDTNPEGDAGKTQAESIAKDESKPAAKNVPKQRGRGLVPPTA